MWGPSRCQHAHVTESDLPKIGAPALRALASIGVTCLEQAVDLSEAELLALHGFGPRALGIIQDALKEKRFSQGDEATTEPR